MSSHISASSELCTASRIERIEILFLQELTWQRHPRFFGPEMRLFIFGQANSWAKLSSREREEETTETEIQIANPQKIPLLIWSGLMRLCQNSSTYSCTTPDLHSISFDRKITPSCTFRFHMSSFKTIYFANFTNFRKGLFQKIFWYICTWETWIEIVFLTWLGLSLPLRFLRLKSRLRTEGAYPYPCHPNTIVSLLRNRRHSQRTGRYLGKTNFPFIRPMALQSENEEKVDLFCF